MSSLFINKTLRLNNLKTRTTMNAKISVFAIFIEAMIYLLYYNLHDCTFNGINYEIYWNLNIYGFTLRINFHCKHPQLKTTNQFCEMNKKPIIGLFWFGNLRTNFILNVWFYKISGLKTLICNLNMEPILT